MDSSHASRLAYIDGLRGVAILSVVGYHAGLPGFSGGFTAVDVFFVISGYLIGGQIADAQRAGTFSFARFYARRFLRILPPLLVVLVAVVAAGFLLPLLPRDVQRVGDSAAASGAMVANWYFIKQTGYFAPAAETEPLLHLWSLGVEEQYLPARAGVPRAPRAAGATDGQVARHRLADGNHPADGGLVHRGGAVFLVDG